ncbi:MAG: cysteine desulfurase [Bacteriovoracaceae bacterium]|jgi:cysteine desulfurase / selenocysteine lyase|nr:cysteine desulfurase [Bacteriovoracaceae bacterium]
MSLDVEKIRKDFPILHRPVRNKELVYLDNAATTLKPNIVGQIVSDHYLLGASNIHRGVHYYSEKATDEYEGVRDQIKVFIGAKKRNEIIFTTGTTHSVNLLAHILENTKICKGDEILISEMEHHSNIIPWQMLCQRNGAVLKVIPINDDGEIEIEQYKKLLSNKTKLVSVVHVSNSLGSINPIKQMCSLAHEAGALMMVDAAQAVAHIEIDVQNLDVDFLAFSGHKIYGPTGIGVLYGKEALLEELPPFFGGGDMIEKVTFEGSTYAGLPHKFEAGTPPIASVLGLGGALSYVGDLGLKAIEGHEHEVLAYGTQKLLEIEGLRIIGTSKNKTSIISFVLGDVHPHDIGTLVDQDGVAIRVGHHCTQPVMNRFKVPATARASVSIYNRKQDFDVLANSLRKTLEFFR